MTEFQIPIGPPITENKFYYRSYKRRKALRTEAPKRGSITYNDCEKEGARLLTADVRSSTHSSESLLPDLLPPNQRRDMGATRGQKRRRSNSSPEPPATARVGGLNRKQARVKITVTDPYSGAAAKDTRTAAQNAEAHARAAAAAVNRDATAPPPASASIPPSVHPLFAFPPVVWYQAAVPMQGGTTAWCPVPVPIPTPYPPRMYVTHTPYHSTYPLHWPPLPLSRP
jgi:hypothetical protein